MTTEVVELLTLEAKMVDCSKLSTAFQFQYLANWHISLMLKIEKSTLTPYTSKMILD